VSITGHGRDGAAAQRIGFGDDAAAAGGLVVSADRDAGPMFCADAVADPLSGLTAAGACLTALAEGGRWLLDVSLARVSASLSGPTLPASPGLTVAEPRARAPQGTAPALGADTAAVIEELGLRR
jgi:crotonobetainyl-CoA:carnitine CoA-transferase CaiB-like acyl-CoA transferase